jgi:hypothetical protein
LRQGIEDRKEDCLRYLALRLSAGTTPGARSASRKRTTGSSRPSTTRLGRDRPAAGTRGYEVQAVQAVFVDRPAPGTPITCPENRVPVGRALGRPWVRLAPRGASLIAQIDNGCAEETRGS